MDLEGDSPWGGTFSKAKYLNHHTNDTTDVRSNSPAAPTPDTEDTPNTETGAHGLR